MRTVIAIALLSASAVAAQAAEDRYGPARPQQASAPYGVQGGPAAAPTPYAGPMLSWTGKVQPQTPAPVAAASAPAGPAPLPTSLYDAPPAPAARVQAHPWLQRTTAPAPPAAPQRPTLPPQYAPPRPAPVAAAPTQPPYRPAYQPQAQYQQPQPAYRPQPQARPQLAGGPPPAAAPQPPVAAAPVAPVAQPIAQPVAPRQVAAAGTDATTARAYSVVREYGGQPDPISLPPPQSYWATRPGVTPDQGVVLDDTMNGAVDPVAETEATYAEDRQRRAERAERAGRAERNK
ncbi:hypothetical protein [Caulobacter mirabilis]|uniref:Uncharacterized protein n=1 Tax=Caulobacter mirabilis TaxID=69666 RepID=A0A2D2B0P5_9CAUL|nr:hypothetical protein [Caulobacter mirabilis]ATQ43820.1 hypothetical protein CSW64_16165 [Caulobacter mirabilis]